MSNSSEEPELAITDDKLPEDLVPGDDNPLASGLKTGEDAGDLLHDGERAEEMDDLGDPGDAGAAGQGTSSD